MPLAGIRAGGGPSLKGRRTVPTATAPFRDSQSRRIRRHHDRTILRWLNRQQQLLDLRAAQDVWQPPRHFGPRDPHHLLRAPQRGLEEEPERCQVHLFILRPGFLLVDQVKEKAADLLFPQLGHRPPIMPEEPLHAPPVGLHRRWAVVRQLQILSQLRVCCSGHLGLLVLRLPTTGLRSHKETPYPEHGPVA